MLIDKVTLYSRQIKAEEFGILAEIASLQLEYTYLGKVTGKKEHYDRVSLLTKLS
jgi:hypothetical protein